MTSLIRIVRNGVINFFRGGPTSLAAILVLTSALFVGGVLHFLDATMKASLKDLESKIGINVYFEPDASKEEISKLRLSIANRSDVKSVEYTDREKVLQDFTKRHQDDEVIASVFKEIDNKNPFGGNIRVIAEEPTQYGLICQSIKDEKEFTNIIEKKDDGSLKISCNNERTQKAIKSLNSIIDSAEQMSLYLAIFLMFVSVLITFNTIQLVIYGSREEIWVMRLVGASVGYVRGPFVVSGYIAGLISAVIALVILYPVSIWLADTTEHFGLDINAYYVAHFWEMVAVIVFTGLALGGISSWLAVRRYLKY